MQLNNHPHQILDIKLSEIFNDFTDALCLIDEQGIVHHSNKAYKNLFGENSPQHVSFISYFARDYHEEISELIKNLFSKKNNANRFEKESVLSNGKKIWLEFTPSFLENHEPA